MFGLSRDRSTKLLRLVVGVTGSMALVVACSKRVTVPEPEPHPSIPHLSWVIGTVDPNTSAHSSVCDSGRRESCVLLASTSERKRMADFHLYLHPAAQETTYRGTVQIGFFREAGSAPSLLDVNEVVPAIATSAQPKSLLLSGVVASQPGEYRVVIEVTATPKGSAATTLRDNVTVVVKERDLGWSVISS